MSAIPYCDDVLPADQEVLPLPDAADLLGITVTRVHQLIRDHKLIAVRRDEVVAIPTKFFGSDGQPVKHLAGLIAVLLDGGFGHPAILRWLYTEDDTLPGMPIDVLHGQHAREVVRRAQAMAF